MRNYIKKTHTIYQFNDFLHISFIEISYTYFHVFEITMEIMLFSGYLK